MRQGLVGLLLMLSVCSAPKSPSASGPSAPGAPVTSPSPAIVVPSLEGLTLSAAEMQLQALGVAWSVERQETTGSRTGTVISQSPGAGEGILLGATVSLIVAEAPDPIPSPGTVKCPGNALLGVYHSYRLTVLGTCEWFVGTVVAIRAESDGDHHVDVAPDKGYGKFLDGGDREHQHGGLLLEIIKGQKLPVPFVGERISVFGTWVHDTNHGWNEIHPIWAINYLDLGSLLRILPPATPLYPSAQAQGGVGGGNCDPAYPGVCLHDGIGDYDCAGGSGNGPNYVAGPIRVLPPDPFGLDSDGDGWGCVG